MGQYIFQCQECGLIHKQGIIPDINTDALYKHLICPRCRDETSHLWFEKEDDLYEMYNLNIDEKYFFYKKHNTK